MQETVKFKTLKEKYCTEMSYRITTAPDIFDVARFAEAIGKATQSGAWKTVTLQPEQLDYHLHVRWNIVDEKTIRLQVDVHTFELESGSGEIGESDFFHWVAKFFATATVNAHLHVEFEYPTTVVRSKIFALPMQVPAGDLQATVDGFSLAFPSEPEGVDAVWFRQVKEKLTTQVWGDRRLDFAQHDPHQDVDAFASVIRNVLEGDI